MWFRKHILYISPEKMALAIERKKEWITARDPWREIMKELRADRGMLLGSSHYVDLTGVERHDALLQIENRIFETKNILDRIVESYISDVDALGVSIIALEEVIINE